MTDYISRADAIEAVSDSYDFIDAIKAIEELPSADAESDDLIIKGAKGIQDGLYNIKDGKLFMYKANGGTVRTYPIVPSADRPTGEWTYLQGSIGSYMTISCPFCGKTFDNVAEWKYNYCPNCGARMKGGAE